MERKFQDGDDVVHKTDKSHRMTVISYKGDGKVVCRWKEKTGFKSEEFLEVELEKWVDTPSVSFGRLQAVEEAEREWRRISGG
jgi:uncharacterized protein YodC (DUF2158 family)